MMRLRNDETLLQLDDERDKRSEMVRERLRKLGLYDGMDDVDRGLRTESLYTLCENS